MESNDFKKDFFLNKIVYFTRIEDAKRSIYLFAFLLPFILDKFYKFYPTLSETIFTIGITIQQAPCEHLKEKNSPATETNM